MSLRRAALALLAVAALASGCSVLPLRGRGGAEDPVVTRIELDGVHAFHADAIEALLQTQAPTHDKWYYPYRSGHRTDPDVLAVDRRRIESYYRERGYYGARVDAADVVPEGPGRAKIVFRVHEGTPVRVTKVDVEGLDAVAPDARARIGALPIRGGQIFTEGAYDAARAQLQTVLRDTGYADAEVGQQAHVLPDQGTAEVTYTVTPGRRYTFGPIFVAGTAKVPRDIVRNRAGVEVKPGNVFDESKLAKAQARVFDLGVFGGVRVTPGKPDEARDDIPVVVQVREAPFRTLRFGPAAAIAATRYEAHGMIGWTHRNFLGDLRRLSLDLTAGWAWIPTVFSRQKQGFVGLGRAELQQPSVIGNIIDLTARLELERGLEEAYDFWSQRVRVGFPIRLAPRWTIVPSYAFELYEVNITGAVDLSAPNASGLTLSSCTRGICLLTYLEQRLAWDGRDSAIAPRRGLYLGLAVQEGFHVIGYGYRYFRFLPEARIFVPVGDRFTLAARGRVGALVPVGEAVPPPLVARFNGGGPASMRGYYTRRLSPMVLQDNAWVPIGGNGLVDGSLELRFAIAGDWGGALFVDGGNVSLPSSLPTAYATALDPTLIQYAAGFGVRYRTPFGPLGIDVAARLPTDWRNGVGFNHRFPTVPGTPHREPIAAVHISLGEAF